MNQQWVSLSDDASKSSEKSDETSTEAMKRGNNSTKEYPTVDAMGRTIVRFPAALVSVLSSFPVLNNKFSC